MIRRYIKKRGKQEKGKTMRMLVVVFWSEIKTS